MYQFYLWNFVECWHEYAFNVFTHYGNINAFLNQIIVIVAAMNKLFWNRHFCSTENRLHLKGIEMTSRASTKGLNGTGGGILMSPFFPARYPRDLSLEYIITCPSEILSCRIRLLFSDFQLATVSIIEVHF